MIHHVAIRMHDLRGAARFYQDVLGLRFDREHLYEDGTLRSIWLRSGESIVMIEEAEPGAVRAGAGWQVVAFSIDASERENVRQTLEAAGFPVHDQTDHTLYTRDPEGNVVALSHFPL